MKRKATQVVLLALLTISTACTSPDRQTTHNEDCVIHGVIVGTNGAPIPDCELSLLWPKVRKATTHSSTSTTHKGEFQLDIPRDQALRLWISAPNRKQIKVPIFITDRTGDATLQVILPSAEDDDHECEITWPPDLEYLSEMAFIRRLATAESAETMRRLYEDRYPEMVPFLGSADPILEREDHEGIKLDSIEKNLATKAPDARSRAFAMIEGLKTGGRSAFLGGINEMTPSEILDIAPLDSPLWGFAPEHLFKVISVRMDPRDNPEAANEILRQILDSNPDRLVQGQALASLVFCAERSGHRETALELFLQLETDYGDLAELDPLRRIFDPERQVRAGLQVPDFSFTLTDGTRISASDLQDRWTLIHIWAKWCGPCISEMPELHLAYETFKNHKFRVLSVSLDKDPDAVENFRKEYFSMPWLHAVPSDGDQDEDVENLNPFGGVPHLLLVSPAGVIVATSEDLREERLIPTLTRHMGPPKRE